MNEVPIFYSKFKCLLRFRSDKLQLRGYVDVISQMPVLGIQLGYGFSLRLLAEQNVD